MLIAIIEKQTIEQFCESIEDHIYCFLDVFFTATNAVTWN